MVWPVNIGDNIVFLKQTHNSSGAASSADSMPEFFVFAGTSTNYVKGSTMFHLPLGDGLYQGQFLVQSSTYPTNSYGSIVTYAAVGGITAADVTPFFIMPTTVARVGANTVSISSGAITNLTFTASAVDSGALAASAVNKISTSINTWSSGIQTTLLTDIRAVSTAEQAALQVWSSGIQTAILSTMARNVWSAIGSSYTSSDTLGYHLWSISTAVAPGGGSTDVNVVSISAGVLAPVWDTTSTAHLIAGTFGEKLYSLSTSAGAGSTDVNVVSMSAGVINEAAFTSSAIGSSALAASAINKISTSINTWSSGIQTTLLNSNSSQSSGIYTWSSGIQSYIATWTSAIQTQLLVTSSSAQSALQTWTSGIQTAITSTMARNVWSAIGSSYTSSDTLGYHLWSVSTGAPGGGSTDVNIVSISSGAITNLAFTASAIDANALATDAVGEIQSSLAVLSDLVNAVWDATSTSHLIAGTMGAKLYAMSTSAGSGSTDVNVVSISAGVLAPVWDTTSTAHLIAGTVGAKLAALSTATGGGSTDVNIISISSGVITNLSFTASAIDTAVIADAVTTEFQSGLLTATTFYAVSTSMQAALQTWSSGIQTALIVSNTSQSSGIYTWSSGIQTALLTDIRAVSTAEQAALQTWSSGIQTALIVSNTSQSSGIYTWSSGIQTAIITDVRAVSTAAQASIESTIPTVAEISTAISVMTGSDPAGVFHPSTHWMSKLDWLANYFLSRQTMNRTSGLTTIYNASTAAIASFTAADDGTTFTRPKP